VLDLSRFMIAVLTGQESKPAGSAPCRQGIDVSTCEISGPRRNWILCPEKWPSCAPQSVLHGSECKRESEKALTFVGNLDPRRAIL
jgi:hypothetical protein